MSEYSKVSWSEGMFIRPQHFQQETRYLEQLIRRRCHVLRPFGWGLTHMEIDRELLATRHFGLRQCAGVFEDGTAFSLQDGDGRLAPLPLTPAANGAFVYLTLPLRRPGSIEIAASEERAPSARCHTATVSALDTHSPSGGTAEINIGKLRLRYALGKPGAPPSDLALPVARITDVDAATGAQLDDLHSPPALLLAASPSLSRMIIEVEGLLSQSAEGLAGRLRSGLDTAGPAELLLLQSVNRHRLQLQHINQHGLHHPETVFQFLLGLVGELTTAAPSVQPMVESYRYEHENPAGSFLPLLAAIRLYLGGVHDRGAVLIPFVDGGDGIRFAATDDLSLQHGRLFADAAIILAARADMEAGTLIQRLPAQLKIGSGDQIQHLVNAALPGVKLRPLPVAPRQIPFRPGSSYFECDRTSPLWKQVQATESLALHVTGEFPGLVLEIWALRG
ncbi:MULTISPECIES: type VI secretion system baseplate subunit TssK [unclassified Chelatococcus]|uniref:type VI secretion system baseplate subunit TssK n=1 Tax=unclassified Chelatococcus TaxID=2638111 RepID=UPI001BCB2E1C|nr:MULTISPECIES: type VI secretion system baseplate subunit TssK [unclassified Chelatococcus]CAH1653539.1 Type VI secretion system protein ImpJ [Hyphomicrobiales bacterium]MBS7740132.1 type VI secretion system baseplate subunit TssK [Chelatococcus sp. HY11]MBX3545039.1 type VI secretion system baseplate subunit TssK [Chelatococcus sp.]MCO5078568.1 type VI secretion system baseplate subunit TssK [Chelatococcus sp.]CAH1685676.1 Type VI secretion system protein ImpJ [Hyphomicrobiales bacterium]